MERRREREREIERPLCRSTTKDINFVFLAWPQLLCRLGPLSIVFIF